LFCFSKQGAQPILAATKWPDTGEIRCPGTVG